MGERRRGESGEPGTALPVRGERPLQVCPCPLLPCQSRPPREMPAPAPPRPAEQNHQEPQPPLAPCPWRGQLCIGGQRLGTIGLRSQHSAGTVPAQLPPSLDIKHVMGLSELKKKIPEAAFGKRNYTKNEVCFQGVFSSLYEVEISPKDQARLDLLVQSLKQKDLAIIKFLQGRGVLILLASSALAREEGLEPKEPVSLLALFLFSSPRALSPPVEPQDTQPRSSGSSRSSISLRIASVVPGLRYALHRAAGSSCSRLQEHLQEFAELQESCQDIPSVPVPSGCQDGDAGPSRAFSEQSLAQLRRYLSDPGSFTLGVSAALQCLRGAAGNVGDNPGNSSSSSSSSEPPGAAPCTRSAGDTRDERELPERSLKSVTSPSKPWGRELRRKSSRIQGKGTAAPGAQSPPGQGSSTSTEAARRKTSGASSSPQKSGSAGNPNEPMLKLANLQLPHGRKRGAEVLAAEIVPKPQCEAAEMEKESSAPNGPAVEAKRPKTLENLDTRKDPVPDSGTTKPGKSKTQKNVESRAAKPQEKQQEESERKEPPSEPPGPAPSQAEIPGNVHPMAIPSSAFALPGDSSDSHALNLLADLALGSCIPALIPKDSAERGDSSAPKSPRAASDHKYHRGDRQARKAPCSRVCQSQAGPDPAHPNPPAAPAKEKTSGIVSRSSAAFPAFPHSIISAEHSYASPMPEDARAAPDPKGNHTRNAPAAPLVGKVLPFRHQQGGAAERGRGRGGAGRKEEFGRRHSVSVCGSALRVTCRWEEQYLFHLDSRYTNDALEKTVIRALHGPWDPDLPDDVEGMKLILHMWVALFYRKPSKLLSSSRKVVEHSNPSKFVSISSSGGFLELSDDSQDCFGSETRAADSAWDPEQSPSSSLDPSPPCQGAPQPQQGPVGMAGDSTVSSSSGELPCGNEEEEEEQEPSSTSCPESLSLQGHSRETRGVGVPEEEEEGTGGVCRVTASATNGEELPDAGISPGPPEELGQQEKQEMQREKQLEKQEKQWEKQEKQQEKQLEKQEKQREEHEKQEEKQQEKWEKQEKQREKQQEMQENQQEKQWEKQQEKELEKQQEKQREMQENQQEKQREKQQEKQEKMQEKQEKMQEKQEKQQEAGPGSGPGPPEDEEGAGGSGRPRAGGDGADPQPARDSDPQPARDSDPQPARDSDPQPARDSHPQPARDSDPQPARDSHPQPARDSDPQPARDSDPQPARDSDPQPARDSDPQPARDSVPLGAAAGSAEPGGAPEEGEEGQEPSERSEKEEREEEEEEKKENEELEDEVSFTGPVGLVLSESSDAEMECEQNPGNSVSPGEFGVPEQDPVPSPTSLAPRPCPAPPGGAGAVPAASPEEEPPNQEQPPDPWGAPGTPGSEPHGAGVASRPGESGRELAVPAVPSPVRGAQPDSVTDSPGDGSERTHRDQAPSGQPWEPARSSGPPCSPDSSSVCPASPSASVHPWAAPEDQPVGSLQPHLGQQRGGDADPSPDSLGGHGAVEEEQPGSPSGHGTEELDDPVGAGDGPASPSECTDTGDECRAQESGDVFPGMENSPGNHTANTEMAETPPHRHLLEPEPSSSISAVQELPGQQQSFPNLQRDSAPAPEGASTGGSSIPAVPGRRESVLCRLWKPGRAGGAVQVSVAAWSPRGSFRPSCSRELESPAPCSPEPAPAEPGAAPPSPWEPWDHAEPAEPRSPLPEALPGVLPPTPDSARWAGRHGSHGSPRNHGSPRSHGNPGSYGSPGSSPRNQGSPRNHGNPGNYGSPGSSPRNQGSPRNSPGSCGSPRNHGNPRSYGSPGSSPRNSPGSCGSFRNHSSPRNHGRLRNYGSPRNFGSPMSCGSPRSCGSPGSPRDHGSPGSYGSPRSCGSPRNFGSPRSPRNFGSPRSCGSPRNFGSPSSPRNYLSPRSCGSLRSHGSPINGGSPRNYGSPRSCGSPGSPRNYGSPRSCGSPGGRGSPRSHGSPGGPGSPRSHGSPGGPRSPAGDAGGSPGEEEEEEEEEPFLPEELEGGSIASPAPFPGRECPLCQPWDECEHHPEGSQGSPDPDCAGTEGGQGDIPASPILWDEPGDPSGEPPEFSDAEDISDALPREEQLPSQGTHEGLAFEDPLENSFGDSEQEYLEGNSRSPLPSRSSCIVRSVDAAGARTTWDSSSWSSEQAEEPGEGWHWDVPRGSGGIVVTRQCHQRVARFQPPRRRSRRARESHLARSLLGTWRGLQEITQHTLDMECLRFHYKLKEILRKGKPPFSTSRSLFPMASPPRVPLSPRSRSPLRVTIPPSEGWPRSRRDPRAARRARARSRERGAALRLARLRHRHRPGPEPEPRGDGHGDGDGDVAGILREFSEFQRLLLPGSAAPGQGEPGVTRPGLARPRRPAELRGMVAELCGALRCHLRRVAAARLPGMFYLLESGQEPFFHRAKALLEARGFVSTEPLSFCSARRGAGERLLVIVRNQDIASHIHTVPCLLELKRCPSVVFAGVDEPEEVTGDTFQELFQAGGFVVSDEELLERVTLAGGGGEAAGEAQQEREVEVAPAPQGEQTAPRRAQGRWQRPEEAAAAEVVPGGRAAGAAALPWLRRCGRAPARPVPAGAAGAARLRPLRRVPHRKPQQQLQGDAGEQRNSGGRHLHLPRHGAQSGRSLQKKLLVTK
ncbi:protein TASOR 2 isoform X3 [Zonotrichia albicollis]|uniref:protein TASOR 2 isoform X3 n=1 Tax=Zonotrichia albicollis TaxID=44394 RepID=UPI003D80E9E8